MVEQNFTKPPKAGNVDLYNKGGSAVLDKPATVSQMPSLPAEEELQVDPRAKDLSEAVESGNPIKLESLCPMCGWKADNDVVDISVEDRRDFVLAALGGKRFVKTYPRLGGRLKVTMRSRSVKETDMIMKQLERARKNNENISTMELLILTNKYQMIVGLKGVDKGEEGQNYGEVSTEEAEDGGMSPIEKREAELMGDWMEAIYSIIQNVSQHFELVVQRLTLRAHDSDFWKAVDTQP